MNIFVSSPVNSITPDVVGRMHAYVEKLKSDGHTVYWPLHDADLTEASGLAFVNAISMAICNADEVHLWFESQSVTTMFVLGAFVRDSLADPNKRLVLINRDQVQQTVRRSYANAVLALSERGQ